MTGQYSRENNVIVAIAEDLSNKLRELSKVYRNPSNLAKKKLIETSREIVNDIKPIEMEAKRIIAGCSDPVLASQVQKALERLPTLAQTFKILTVVKSTNAFDLDADRQLVICAENILKSLTQVLMTCEVASIRGFRSAAAAAMGVVKFRRKIYAKLATK